MLAEGVVGPGYSTDTNVGKIRLDRQNSAVTHMALGQYYEQCSRGNAFVYHVASQAILLSATTGGHPTVINPLGSGVNFVPLGLRICFTSGTTTIGSVLVAATTKVSAIATGTGSPILTATQVAPVSALVGYGANPKTLWSPTTNTFTAAPTVINSAINLATADPTSGFVAENKFDGSLVFAPGSAMSVTYSVTSSTSIWHMTIIGLEVPV